MSNCIFCRIAEGSLPSKIIYDDEYTMAILDIAPERPGHTIVIPKKHCENLLDCDQDTLLHVMNAVRLVTRNLKTGGAKAIKVVQNTGAPLQEVFHLHFHVIPYND